PYRARGQSRHAFAPKAIARILGCVMMVDVDNRLDRRDFRKVMSKILLVDDDAFTIEAYRKKLLAQGFEVQTAADGLAAVKMLNQERPDLVVLDLMMPKFNGFEVLKYVRSQEGLKDLRVVVLSNFYTSDGTDKGGVSQADVSLLKSNCIPVML